MIKGKLHSIETFGAVDGPGIRTIFFLQGCPARCLYCHNPDTWKMNEGDDIKLDEVLHTSKRSMLYYGDDGGVTFSGGEPLMQGKFLLAAVRMLKENGIGSVIDTSATYIDEYTEDVISECEMLLLDVKHSDPKQFEDICGCKQVPLLRIIELANKYNTPIWVRQVIVPGINDTVENIKALSSFVKDNVKNIYNVELLGYHVMALNKYEKLNIKYRLEGVEPMDRKKLAELSLCLQEELQHTKTPFTLNN